MTNEVVYVDVLLFENLFMNYAMLYSIRDYMGRSTPWWRMLGSALIGAAYLLVLVVMENKILYSSMIRFGISILMIEAAYSIKGIKELIKAMILFYISAFIMGGVMIGQCYFLDQSFSILNNTIVLKNMNLFILITGAFISIVLVKLSFGFFMNNHRNRENDIQITIWNNNKCVKLNALLDTGNTLRDPRTNKSVIIVYYGALQKIVPQELIEVLSSREALDISLKIEALPKDLRERVNIITYRALGNENGRLISMEVDYVETYCGAKQENKKYFSNPFIALYDRPLSENGSFDAIISPDLLYGG